MEDIIITISREYGCGARLVGEKLAQRLGIPYYDKYLVDTAAERSGLTTEFIERTEQRNTGGSFFGTDSIIGSIGGIMGSTTSLADQVYLAEFGVIRDLAKQGSCVIVGRCADVILKDDFRCLKVFMHASMDKRIERAINSYGIAPEKAEKMVKDTDKARAKHYRYYSDQKWGDASNYDISLDIGVFTVEGAANILYDCIQGLKK